jgi:pyruvate ferredoxin oxidoreductase beta subunit
MDRVIFNRQIGTSPYSSLLPDPVVDVGEYGAVPTTGLVSGHQGCTGCGMLSGVNQALRALKLTRRHIVASIGTGCMEVVTTQNTSCWGEVSVDHNNFPNTASTLSGHVAAAEALRSAGLIPADGVLTVGIAGDGGTYDIGLQALLGWVARGEDGLYICLNNEAYMNTGIQSSGATPFGTATATTPFGKLIKGNQRTQQHLPDLALAAGVRYVATATPALHRDLMIKIQKAALIPGPAVVEIFSVCPPGWRSDTDVFHEVASLALESRALILYEAERHQELGATLFTLNYAPRRFVPVEEYFALQGRFSGMRRHPDMVATLQRRVEHRWSFWAELLRANGIELSGVAAGEPASGSGARA